MTVMVKLSLCGSGGGGGADKGDGGVNPNFRCAANVRLAIITHTMEVHYGNAGTAGKLIDTPIMSVLTWKSMYTAA